MKIRVLETEAFIINLRARMPFRYGIVTMTRLPHLFLRATVQIDGRTFRGVAADHLPPKWFTKDPATHFRDDVADMLRLISHAGEAARQLGDSSSMFEFWQRLYQAQKSWAEAETKFPPLLWGFGVSLVERAVLEAFCRAAGKPFAQLLRENAFEMQLRALYPELGSAAPAEFLPAAPLREMISRHTVGLTDPLTDEDIPAADRVDDGLPQSLASYLERDGVTHLKIKLGGNIESDRARLHRIAEVVRARGVECAFTLDGNENYKAVAPFRQLWEAFLGDGEIARFLQHLIFVEQPLHRDVALNDATAQELLAWEERPPIIIDESDADIGCLPRALSSGYAGTSHKNCKGVFKGIANGCLLESRRRANPAAAFHMSAEDLSNVGPISLQQDLAVVATLGITHAERNGHHYFAGLSQFPPEVQSAALAAHPDLFEEHHGYPIVKVRRGRLAIGSVVDAPFGAAYEIDLTHATPATEWDFDSLG